MDTVTSVALVASAILAGLITILAAVAPLTKSDLDNKILAAMRWVRDMIAKLIGAAPGSTPGKPGDKQV